MFKESSGTIETVSKMLMPLFFLKEASLDIALGNKRQLFSPAVLQWKQMEFFVQ